MDCGAHEETHFTFAYQHANDVPRPVACCERAARVAGGAETGGLLRASRASGRRSKTAACERAAGAAGRAMQPRIAKTDAPAVVVSVRSPS